MYSTSSGARATFRHRARAEEALQYSSLIATEELTELVRPGATGPDAGLCPRRSGPLSLHLAHPCEMCARGRRPSYERRLIGRLMHQIERRRVPKDLPERGLKTARLTLLVQKLARSARIEK